MKYLLVIVGLVGMVSLGMSLPAQAINVTGNCPALNQSGCGIITENKLDSSNGQPSALKSGLNIAFLVLGMISVVMIVVGGLKFTASNGDPSIITSARNTVLFAIIGLIVAAMAYAIVNTFVGFL